MKDTKIFEAKMQYIKTGRLNQNVVSKEIAISWYKCKLQNIATNESIKLSKHEVNNHFSDTFINYIDSIVSDAFQYALSNTNLQVCKCRIHDPKLMKMNSIDDLLIGTNGGYNASKNQKVQVVSKDEHYLDDLANYYTIGIPIIVEDKSKGTLMIICEQMPSEYEVSNIKEKLIRFYSKDAFKVTLESQNHSKSTFLKVDMLLTYPNDYWPLFKQQLDNLTKSLLPRVIIGDDGCGKTTLAWYLGLQGDKPYYMDMKLLHPLMQPIVLENALYHNETVIVDNIEYCSRQSATLLTVYTDRLIESIKKPESSKYKCLTLYVTTAYNNKITYENEDSSRIISTLLEKLKISSLHMLNLNDFKDQYEEIVEIMMNRINDNDRPSRASFWSQLTTFKALANEITNFDTSYSQVEPIKSLEEHEKDYILKIYNELNCNVTSTAETLGIGRSTLYRKLEKYQNETN